MVELKMINQVNRQAGTIGSTVAQLATGFEKIGLALKSRSWRREGRAGLGPLQRQVLILLRSKSGQTAQVSEIAGELVVRLPTASEAVATLERKHLVRRKRTNRDGRIVTVELTVRGRKAAGPSDGRSDHLAGAIDELPRDEQQALLRTMLKVIRLLQERGEISVARMCISCQYFRPAQHKDRDRPHHCAFVDAPFGDGALRIDCPDYGPASVSQAREAWAAFSESRAANG